MATRFDAILNRYREWRNGSKRGSKTNSSLPSDSNGTIGLSLADENDEKNLESCLDNFDGSFEFETRLETGSSMSVIVMKRLDHYVYLGKSAFENEIILKSRNFFEISSS